MGVFAWRFATHLPGGSGTCSTKKIFNNGAIWCVLENVLQKFGKKINCKYIHFYIKRIYSVLLRTLYLGVLEHTPKFLLNCATWCVLEQIFRELSLKKIYINLNNIDILLPRTSYRYEVFLE